MGLLGLRAYRVLVVVGGAEDELALLLGLCGCPGGGGVDKRAGRGEAREGRKGGGKGRATGVQGGSAAGAASASRPLTWPWKWPHRFLGVGGRGV